MASKGIVGWYGHSFFRDGQVNWQFRIVAFDGALYAVQTHGWRSGTWKGEYLVSPADMAKCSVYSTEAEWRAASAGYIERQNRRVEREAEDRKREHADKRCAELIAMFG